MCEGGQMNTPGCRPGLRDECFTARHKNDSKFFCNSCWSSESIYDMCISLFVINCAVLVVFVSFAIRMLVNNNYKKKQNILVMFVFFVLWNVSRLVYYTEIVVPYNYP